MALQFIPNAAWDISTGWSLEYPNQRIIDTPSGTDVINYGIGRWVGEIEIGIMQTNQEARSVEAFFDSLRGSANEFDLLMRRDADLTNPNQIRVTATDLLNGVRRFTLTTGTLGLKAGDMIQVGNRAFRLVTDVISNQILVEPNATVATNALVIWKNAKMRVRLIDGSVTSFANPSFTGPWSFRVTEAL